MRNRYLLIIGLVILLAVPVIVRTGTCAQPVVSVNPSFKEVQIGDLFDIDINIDSVSNMYGFEIWLSFDKIKLNASAIEYRGFLNEPTNLWNNVTNNTGGYLSFAISSRLPATGKTGGSPPPLITIHFKALSGGFSPLQFITSKTILADDQGLAIPHTTVDGTVHVAGGSNHDVAATNLITPKTVVGKGYTDNLTATVQNQGDFAETFNVTLFANMTIIATKTVTNLQIGDFSFFEYSWNTSGLDYGNYTLKAVAETVPGETNTANNNFTCIKSVHVGVPGDVSGPIQGVYDKIVNMRDIQYMILLFNAKPGSTNWNPNADVNNDAVVNMRDINIAILNFNKHE
jgi:hypothetical protein